MDNEVEMGAMVKKIELGITAVTSQITATLQGEVQVALTEILEAALEITPLEFGDLRASGKVVLEAFEGGASGAVTFGDESGGVDYAAIVHERLDVHHPIGQAKYLEVGARKATEAVIKRLNRALAKAAE